MNKRVEKDELEQRAPPSVFLSVCFCGRGISYLSPHFAATVITLLCRSVCACSSALEEPPPAWLPYYQSRQTPGWDEVSNVAFTQEFGLAASSCLPRANCLRAAAAGSRSCCPAPPSRGRGTAGLELGAGGESVALQQDVCLFRIKLAFFGLSLTAARNCNSCSRREFISRVLK